MHTELDRYIPGMSSVFSCDPTNACACDFRAENPGPCAGHTGTRCPSLLQKVTEKIMIRIGFFAVMILSAKAYWIGDPFRMVDEVVSSIQDKTIPARVYTPDDSYTTYIPYENSSAMDRAIMDKVVWSLSNDVNNIFP